MKVMKSAVAMLSLAVVLPSQQPGPPAVAGKLSAATLPADWQQRDLEGKWVAYRRAMLADKSGKAGQTWAMALGEANELQLLEWIAVYEGWRFAGPQLVRYDAPQLLRCAVWNLGAFDSHVKDAAKKALLARADRVLGWFDAYPSAVVGLAAELRAELRDRGAEPRRERGDLPPFDAMQMIVPWLDAPGELPVFGDRKIVEPRVRYRHQVVRALGAVLINGDRDGRIVTKVTRLTGHRDAVVRKAAFDTLARLPAGMVPFAAMAKIVDDDQQAAARRRSAVVVLASSSHPLAMQLLVRLALDPSHPAHAVAGGRLVDKGDPVGVDALRQAHVATAEHERVIDQIVMAVEKHHREGLLMQPLEMRRVLLRVAWLRVQEHELAPAVAAATAGMLRTGAPDDLKPVLERFLELPAPPSPFAVDVADRVEQELRSYVQELLRK